METTSIARAVLKRKTAQEIGILTRLIYAKALKAELGLIMKPGICAEFLAFMGSLMNLRSLEKKVFLVEHLDREMQLAQRIP